MDGNGYGDAGIQRLPKKNTSECTLECLKPLQVAGWIEEFVV